MGQNLTERKKAAELQVWSNPVKYVVVVVMIIIVRIITKTTETSMNKKMITRYFFLSSF